MKKCAIIIDNRPSKKLDEIIQRHMDFLPGWDLKQINNVVIRNLHDYNRILTEPKFWSNLNYDKVLIFQHDSMMLKEIPEEMLQYDYVGGPWKKNAPWNTPDRRGGNGGISIRDVKAHLELTQKSIYNPSKGNEDVWYSHNLPNVAPYEICCKFGVETEFMLGTCTYHAIDKHLTPEQCEQIKNQYGGN
jgi:hypothetical protein